MNVCIKDSSGYTQMGIDTHLLSSQRIIFINGEISTEMAMEVSKQLIYLAGTDRETPINMIINSQGGSITAGMLIYDIMQSKNMPPVHTWCFETCYSMAALIFAAGDRRFVLPHSELLLHEPLIGNKISGNISSIKAVSESLLSTRDKLNKLIARHTGKSAGEIENETSYDHFFNAEEAVEFNLADEICDIKTLIGG